ncbi:MAG: MBL fold metallo-hydrolase [Flavobacteriaceae bacterium]|nr:MBL fold metallo-hydrolase [Flavobacteriaceae bacterium]
MMIEQLYTKCLAQGAYFIVSDGEAAVIDPLREIEPYLEKAKEQNAKIKYIFETHFHADFVSGHVSLSRKTGAPIVYGPTAEPGFGAVIAKDGQAFKVGQLTITALHTPGHTMESTTYLLKDASGKDIAIFSGDTLFLGDVGRPDLAQKAANLSQEELAGILYDSLRTKIMPLADDVLVYPAHGAGSACGKNMMKETVDTLGNQKKVNYALRADMTKEEFIKEVTEGLLPPPAYFPANVALNKKGYEDLEQLKTNNLNALKPQAFEEKMQSEHAIVLDVRHQSDFIASHIPNSIFIGLDGGFAPWVGAVLKDIKTPLLLVTPSGREEETITRLARVGFDHVLGYLEGGIEAWEASEKSIEALTSVDAQSLETAISNGANVVDVRNPGEIEAAHIKSSTAAPLGELDAHFDQLKSLQPFYVHCAGGYRSVIAASLLKRNGISEVVDVAGGFAAIKNTQIPLEQGTTCSA